jgi:hypothetical protein
MKVAYHFDADHKMFNGFYGIPIQRKVFQILLNHRSINISSKLFVGDLLLHMISMDIKRDGNTETHTLNKEKYLQAFFGWQNPDNFIWRKYTSDKVEQSHNKNIFVLCFESIDLKTAEYLNTELESYEPYLGALEVDESSKFHWALFGGSLISYARIHNKSLHLFYQEEDDKDTAMLDDYKKLPFTNVEFECLNGKYTIFDTYTGYEEARRISEWKRNSGALLAFVADDIVSRLSDIAPDLGNKLWTAIKTFEEAETNEQLAQVTASCRRIFEYVTDKIFPPSDTKTDGHSLKAGDYKNRLYAYADTSRKSDTNIDLIIATTNTLFEQWEKLNDLANKGVHSEVFRLETRRCLLRTIMLLDDIVSLKEQPFDIKPNLNFDFIFGDDFNK